jgi:hypothetical protein
MESRTRLYLGLLGLVVAQAHAQTANPTTELISATLVGAGSESSILRALSPDGRWVLYNSSNPQLVRGDTNGEGDVFVRDRSNGRTVRVNVSTSGQQANGDSSSAGSISSDGRYVAFISHATNLAPGDTNGMSDVFLRDTVAGITERVNLAPSGAQALGGESYYVFVSDDGRFVLFGSEATNLSSETAAGGSYLRDRLTRTTSLVSLSGADQHCLPSAMTGDGRVATFSCRMTGAYVREIPAGSLERIVPDDATATATDITSDGRFISVTMRAAKVAADTNDRQDVYVFDRSDRSFERASVGPFGQQSDGAYAGHMSEDARYVSFITSATNFRPGDVYRNPELYVRDRKAGTTILASVSENGAPGNNYTYNALLSGNGQTVAFDTGSTNLVPEDAGYGPDVYVRTLGSAPSTAAFTLQPRVLDFGAVKLGATALPQSVTISNTGTAALEFAWIGIAGIDRAAFERARHCPKALAPGASCTVQVTFTPLEPGSATARLVVSIGAGVRKSTATTGSSQ